MRWSAHLIIATFLLLACASAARADAPASQPAVISLPPPPLLPRWIELHADLQNLFLVRSDSDFDPTPFAYSRNGQSVGVFATVFRPSVTLHPLPWLSLFYQVELGLNYWSKQSPDEIDPLAFDFFVMKQREVYAEGQIDRFGFKVGYQRFLDPTGLFLHHWIGLAQTWVDLTPRLRLGIFGGQIPDPVHEGIYLDRNNFEQDIFVVGANGVLTLGETSRLVFGIPALIDNHLVGQQRWLLGPSVHVEGGTPSLNGFIDVIAQVGQQRGVNLDGSTQVTVSGAVQLHGLWSFRRLTLQANLLALSPDDASDGNAWNGSFLYSGKSKSATVMLTEDELRDWYDNLDERISGYRNGFFQNRAGLLVADMKATYDFTPLFGLSAIVGSGNVLNPKNVLNQFYIGLETDLLAELRFTDYLVLQGLVGALIPGSAGAALINTIDRTKTRAWVMSEVSFLVRY